MTKKSVTIGDVRNFQRNAAPGENSTWAILNLNRQSC